MQLTNAEKGGRGSPYKRRGYQEVHEVRQMLRVLPLL